MMNRLVKDWKRSTALAMTLLIFGCGTMPKSGGYPTYPIPERPEVAIQKKAEGGRLKDEKGEYCMSGDDLRKINGHVVKLEDLAKKYECEINTINGKSCEKGE